MRLNMSEELLLKYIRKNPKHIVNCIHNNLRFTHGIKLNWDDVKIIAIWLIKKHKVNLFSINTSCISAPLFILTLFIDDTDKHRYWIVKHANLARVEVVKLCVLIEALKRIPKNLLIELLQTM